MHAYRIVRLISRTLASALIALTLFTHRVGIDAAGAWSADTDAPAALGEVSVAALNGIEYLAGGSSASGAVNTLYAFDPSTHTWQTRPPYPGAERDHMGMVAVGGYLNLAGGLSGLPGPSVTTFQRYDPATNTWTTLTPMPRARAGFGMAAINGRIYAAGGIVTHDDTTSLGDFTVYDIATDSWQSLPPLPTPRDHLSAVELNGRFYAIAGRAGTNAICSPYKVVEVFDPASGTWSTAPPLSTARAGLAVSVANGRIQVFGGDGNTAGCGPNSVVEEFDPVANGWSALAPMPTPRYGIGAASIGGLIYISAGRIDGGSRVATHDRFDPTATTPTEGTLPSPWRDQDVGAVGMAGGASASNSVFTSAARAATSGGPLTRFTSREGGLLRRRDRGWDQHYAALRRDLVGSRVRPRQRQRNVGGEDGSQQSSPGDRGYRGEVGSRCSSIAAGRISS